MSWKGAALGLAAGVISGLFGVGGGILIVPGLVLLLGFQHKEAAATSLVAIVVASTAAAVRFGADDAIELDTALILFVAAAAGAYGGKLMTDRLSNAALSWIFVAMMLAAAVRMLTGNPGSRALVEGALEVPVLLAVGLLAGVLSASLGIGGGIVFVPALVALLGFSQTTGQGTSLATIVPTAVVGATLHAREGRVVWPTAIPLALGGLVGGLLGAEIALGLAELTLRRTFAGFLLIMAVQLSLRTWRLSHAAAR